jgi:NitT/TauT family transport system ATP-binding protein
MAIAITPDVAPGAGEARFSARALRRSFDTGKEVVEALGPFDLEVAEGEFLCIVGPSGCGKSTFLRVLAGLVKPSDGEIEIRHHDPKRPLVGMVFQDHSIYPWKTVEANARFGLDILGNKPKRERNEIVAYHLARLGLTEFARALPDTLSGGMRQRVAIARALALEPELLLMDEPFAALDAQLRTLLQDQLVELWEADRRTVVFITHSIEEAIYLGDRVVVMSARPGRMVAEFPVPFPRPRNDQLRGSAEFASMHQEIWDVLRGEVDRHLASLMPEGKEDASHGDDV